jgi:Ran GTPase-activating protein (RanGAP) involved in mRNA processing and transport
VNISVTNIDLSGNEISDEGASALADALKVNKSVTSIDLSCNEISDEGASALADALKVNTSLTNIDLCYNKIGDEGASALANALKVNTSVTEINLGNNEIDASHRAKVDKLIARNKCLRQLFLFDARKMLLSVLCADECGALWPYVLDDNDKFTGVSLAPDNVELLRVEFAAVVEERRRCAAAAELIRG